MKFFIILGAWMMFLPINVMWTTVMTSLQYIITIFNMPVDLWYHLNEEYNNIHIEDE